HVVTNHRSQSGDVGTDDRRAAGLRLEPNQTKGFAVPGHYANVGRRMEERKLVVRNRAEKIDVVTHAELRWDRLEAHHLALVSVAAVLAKHEQPNVIVTAVAKQREGANRNFDYFESLQQDNEEEQATRPVSDLPASFLAVDRLEH